MKFDRVWFSVFSDLWINLAAGWFGAAVIVPMSSRFPIRINFGLLTINFVFGIVALMIAYKLKKKGRGNDRFSRS